MLTPPLVTIASTSAASSATRREDGGRVVVDRRLPDAPRRPLATTAASSMYEFDSWICPGRNGSPGGTSSAPVETTATRGRRPDQGVGVAGRREEGHPPRVDHHAGLQDDLPLLDVLAGRPDRRPDWCPGPDLHRLGAAVGVLHLDDRVRALGQHRARS